MKKFLLATAATALLSTTAFAADLPRRAEPPPLPPAPPLFTWTGVYIGTHTSYVFTDKQRISTVGNGVVADRIVAAGLVPGAVTSEQDKFAKFGGGFGINYQFTPGSGFVVGFAFDADWTDVHKNTFVVGQAGGLTVGNLYFQELSWLATANGRVGYAFDHFLVYGTGGAAIGRVDYAQSGFFPNGTQVLGGSGGAHEVGFNYGGGIEYAIPKDSFLANFSVLGLLGINLGGTTTVKAEYIRYDLGHKDVLVTDGFGTNFTSRFRTEGSIVRAGLTYKFP